MEQRSNISIYFLLCVCFDQMLGANNNPKLSVYPSNEVQDNQSVTLTCETINTRNHDWYSSSCGIIYISYFNRTCEIDIIDACSERYNISCSMENGTFISEIIIYAERIEEEHNTIWTCQKWQESAESVTLYVKVPVQTVTLTSNRDKTDIFYLSTGEKIILTCITSASRPATKVDWFVNGALIKDDCTHSMMSNYSGPGSINGPKLVTFSTITLTWKENWDSQIFLCKASNKPTILSDNVTVFYAVPVHTVKLTAISNNSGNVFLSTDEIVTLTCVTSASRPAARLDWFIDGKNITNDSEYHKVSNYSGAGDLHGPPIVTISSIILNWTKDSTTQSVVCKASNTMTILSNVATFHSILQIVEVKGIYSNDVYILSGGGISLFVTLVLTILFSKEV